jgi:hypothetical protein
MVSIGFVKKPHAHLTIPYGFPTLWNSGWRWSLQAVVNTILSFRKSGLTDGGAKSAILKVMKNGGEGVGKIVGPVVKGKLRFYRGAWRG